VAEQIGPGLARAAIAGKVRADATATVVDLHRPLPGDCRLEILTASDENADSLLVLRHSTAHVMAEAICKLVPGTKLVYGPPLEDGFYYDIDAPQSITPEAFAKIEAEMARVIAEDRRFTRYELPRQEALAKLADEGNRYKIDNAVRAEGDRLSFYVTGERRGTDFEDLCRGPHIPRTGLIGAFKIKQVSGSYYRGDVNEQRLQRVYGTAFFKKKSLDEYLKQLEEAKARDHRALGKELGLFAISPEAGSGLILWLPKGAIVRSILQAFLSDELIKLGYQPVYTPHIGRLEMYRRSGHYPYYEDSQFPALYETDRGKTLLSLLHLAKRGREQVGRAREEASRAVAELAGAVQRAWGSIDGLEPNASLEKTIEVVDRELRHEEGYLLKPMNCPHHIQIYAAQPRSYRDLPVRLAEFGTVYRFEQSGELAGLVRVRGFTQDDAHLFCTADQLADELLATIDLTRRVLETLDLKNYRVRVGLRDPAADKYVGSTENWKKAEDALREVVKISGLAASEEVGEAAFYGPKIDFVIKDAIGREWQLGTVQVDYNLPERFGLTYAGSDNAPHRPVMIHRAPFGSLERFIGILIEHFAGAFPLWLAPVQVAVATVSEKSEGYGRQVHAALSAAGLRAELDTTSEKIGPKKHRLRAQKIPYILVVGEQEAARGEVNVNDRDGRMLGNFALEAFSEQCRVEIASRSRESVLQKV
jgi:threonyl-tRNA synthetase